MRHGDKNKKFGRERDQRQALMQSLARSLVLHGEMQTTLAKAKAVRPMVEKLVTRAKEPATLHDRRLLVSRVGEEAAAHLLGTVAPKFRDRRGGYTRITKLSDVRKDGSQRAIISFL